MKRQLFHTAAILDGDTIHTAPGALLVEGNRIVAAGSPQEIGPVSDAQRIDLPRAVLIPALVNAHAHLDLTHIGPRPYGGEFVQWIEMIRSERQVEPAAVAASVLEGVRKSIAGGTALIGDIAGMRSFAAVNALRDSPLGGVSFLEIFGIGTAEDAAIEWLRSIAEPAHSALSIQNAALGFPESSPDGAVRFPLRIGLQPHAPYSCSRRVYEEAAATGLPLATHLLETPEEVLFIREGRGPFAEMLRRFGIWDDRIAAADTDPLDHLAGFLERGWSDGVRRGGVIAVHLNDLPPGAIERLARWGVHVAYCPRASAYFALPRDGAAPHAYRTMLDHGVNVALGTDSIVCLDTPDRISVLDDMRLLHARDGTPPRTLLRMATINGARALGAEPQYFTFRPGPSAGILGIDLDECCVSNPLARFLEGVSSPRWILGVEPSGPASTVDR